MADNQQQVQQVRTRRSQRNGTQQPVQSDGQAYADSQQRLEEIDGIITDMVTPSTPQDSVVLGGQDNQNVRPLSSEELVNSFRQQGGE
ncbi:MAG: hypothetical protein JXQ72_16920 [Anaerolineae bacterium]|nr:hypothetical protein [Anaerolineae bacterium]